MDILKDLKVKLADEFDRNFTRKAFFDKVWQPRRNDRRGSLLLVSGKLRRSLKAHVSQDGVHFTSAMPYAVAHNEGFEGNVSIRTHTRKAHKAKRRVHGRMRRVDVHGHSVSSYTRKLVIPQRRFVGDHPEIDKMVEKIALKHFQRWGEELVKELQKHTHLEL
jgi:phage virion morphogenesis family